MTAPAAAEAVDFDAIKVKQQANWAAGDYAVIGTSLQLIGELLCEAVDVGAGERVVDVAAGNGNAALAAARRGAEVFAVDYVPELLQRLEARAAADGVVVEARIGDAEALPLPDGSVDVALSSVGVMFTPNQERAAAELVRVCRAGGRIGLANWTPQSYVGGMFRAIGRAVPPPAGIRSPLEWGTVDRLHELFGAGTSALHVERRDFVFRYRSATEFIEVFRRFYGPMVKAFEALDDDAGAALFAELVALVEQHDVGGGAGVRVPSEYLEVVVTVDG